MHAGEFVKRRRDDRDDLQLQFNVIRRRAVVVGLRIENVVLQRCKVFCNRRGVALTPARMVEDRVMQAFESQQQREEQNRAESDAPAYCACLNVQYLLMKKLVNVPTTVAASHVVEKCACPNGPAAHHTNSPKPSEIKDTVRNCKLSRSGWALDRNVHMRFRYQLEIPPAMKPIAKSAACGNRVDFSSAWAMMKLTIKPEKPTVPNLTNCRMPRRSIMLCKVKRPNTNRRIRR